MNLNTKWENILEQYRKRGVKRKVVIVSLFDGLSGGRVAFDRVEHIEVLRYYSAEIDKYAIQVADKNYPQDTPYRLGSVVDIDVLKLKEEIKRDFGDVNIILIGGSPCQGFSMAGKLKGSSTKCGKDVVTLQQYLTLKEMNFEFDGQSYLFWEYVRIMHELNPDYFMLENVRVTKKWLPMFNEAMSVEPTRINSSLVSAQNRDRYYWHSFGHIEQPENKSLLLRDVLEDIEISKPLEKYMTEDFDGVSRMNKGVFNFMSKDKGVAQTSDANHGNKQIIEDRPCELRSFKEESVFHHTATDIKGNESIKRVYADSGKSPTMTTCQGGHREPKVLIDKIKNVNPSGNGMNGWVFGTDAKSPTVTTNKGEGNKISSDEGSTYRKLTPLECERLQTLPDNYTEGVSNSQRYKMIGNGWTIDVPAHIFRHIPLDED